MNLITRCCERSFSACNNRLIRRIFSSKTKKRGWCYSLLIIFMQLPSNRDKLQWIIVCKACWVQQHQIRHRSGCKRIICPHSSLNNHHYLQAFTAISNRIMKTRQISRCFSCSNRWKVWFLVFLAREEKHQMSSIMHWLN